MQSGRRADDDELRRLGFDQCREVVVATRDPMATREGLPRAGSISATATNSALARPRRSPRVGLGYVTRAYESDAPHVRHRCMAGTSKLVMRPHMPARGEPARTSVTRSAPCARIAQVAAVERVELAPRRLGRLHRALLPELLPAAAIALDECRSVAIEGLERRETVSLHGSTERDEASDREILACLRSCIHRVLAILDRWELDCRAIPRAILEVLLGKAQDAVTGLG